MFFAVWPTHPHPPGVPLSSGREDKHIFVGDSGMCVRLLTAAAKLHPSPPHPLCRCPWASCAVMHWAVGRCSPLMWGGVPQCLRGAWGVLRARAQASGGGGETRYSGQ